MAQLLYEGGNIETQNINLAERQEKILERLKEIAPLVYDYELKTGKALAVSSENTTRISYASKNSDADNDSKRVSTTFNRYIRRQLKVDTQTLPDHELNSIGEKVMKAFVESKFEVVQGIAIAEAYMQSYGNSSCMTGGSLESVKNLLALYIENPEKIKLVKFEYGSSQARALIWYVSENEIFIDRIYANSCNIINELKSKIKSHYQNKKIIFRNHNCLPNGEEAYTTYNIELKKPTSGEYPYLDTFRFFCEDTATAILLSNDWSNKERICNYCNGGTGELQFCDDCHEYIEDDYTYIEQYERHVCENCLDDNYRYCNSCHTYHREENCTQLSEYAYICNECLTEYYNKCSHCNKYHLKTHTTKIDTDVHICRSCLDENYMICHECGKYHLSTDLETVKKKNSIVFVCRKCIKGKIEICISCDSYHYIKDMFFFFGSYYCSDCELETIQSNTLQVA